MTEIYLHSVARMADYCPKDPALAPLELRPPQQCHETALSPLCLAPSTWYLPSPCCDFPPALLRRWYLPQSLWWRGTRRSAFESAIADAAVSVQIIRNTRVAKRSYNLSHACFSKLRSVWRKRAVGGHSYLFFQSGHFIECRQLHLLRHIGISLKRPRKPRHRNDVELALLPLRLKIIGTEIIKTVGKSQSCMVCRLPADGTREKT